jgi:AraC family transcriptional regulator
MRLEMPTVTSDPQYAASWRELRTFRAGYHAEVSALRAETAWRCLRSTDNPLPTEADILVSRWVDPRSYSRYHETVSSPDRYVIGVALKTTRLKLTTDSQAVFDGIMPSGTVHVTGPSQPLAAEFRSPCDFVHFHVANDYLRLLQDTARSGIQPQRPDLNNLVIRDPLAELLSRTLVESGGVDNGLYAESVGQTLVMHVARMERPQSTVNVLPKWRLKRVREHIDAHLDETLSLADLAAVAGLSRMHFAAQFRAATGYRPHDYLLYERIEKSKTILSSTDMPLAEVALTVGFQAQAHFTTVFKRITGETPGCWRRANTGGGEFSGYSHGPTASQDDTKGSTGGSRRSCFGSSCRSRRQSGAI